MPQTLYMVYDTVSEAVTGPVLSGKNDAVITRIFAEAVRDKNVLGRHANDYQLLRLGTMDDEGIITPNVPVVIATGSEFVDIQETLANA